MKVQRVKGVSSLSTSKAVPQVPVAHLVGHDDQAPISVVHFTNDGKYCLTGAHDRSIRLWNPSRLDPAFPPPPRIDHNHLEDDFVVDHLPRSLCLQTYRDGITHEVSALAINESNETLISACDKSLVIHNVVTGQCHRRRLGSNHHTGRINAVAMGPQAQTYLTASYDATVNIWDARNMSSFAPIQSLKDAKDSVTDVHVDPIKSHLIRTCSVDGRVRTYDIRMGVLTEDHCHAALTSMAVSNDGQCLAVHGLDDATIRLLDVSDDAVPGGSILLNSLVGHHKAGRYALQSAFTNDGLALVTGSEDGSAILYHVVTAEPMAVLQGHSKPTCAVATSPKSGSIQAQSAVITASYDGHAVVWAQNYDFMKWQDS